MAALLYFLIVIGILVFVHEWGHFIAARMSGIRCDIFSLGMGYRLLGWHRKTGFKFGELPEDFDFAGTTDYRLSLLPIGGYVKIAGMVDESMDTSYAATEPKPDEFRSKNFFQKTITLSGGVIMNLVLAIVIFASIAFVNGDEKYATNEIAQVSRNSIASQVGLKDGDRVISINGVAITDWNQLIENLLLKDLSGMKTISILRASQNIDLKIDANKITRLVSEKSEIGLLPKGLKVYLNDVVTLEPAGRAGLKKHDTILYLNNIKINTSEQFNHVKNEGKGKPFSIVYKRGSKIDSTIIKTNSENMFGVVQAQIYTGKEIHVSYGLIESINIGWNKSFEIVHQFGQMIKQLTSGNVKFKNAVGGPIMIAKQSALSAERGLESFLTFLAMISMSLATINILPFPALDGGHLVVVIIESIIRRELPLKAKLIIQNAGFAILMLLMVYVVYLDIIRK